MGSELSPVGQNEDKVGTEQWRSFDIHVFKGRSMLISFCLCLSFLEFLGTSDLP